MAYTNEQIITKFAMFGYNYPHNFIQDAWAHNPSMAKHLQSKFTDYYNRYGSMAVMNNFWTNLDGTNREILTTYILSK